MADLGLWAEEFVNVLDAMGSWISYSGGADAEMRGWANTMGPQSLHSENQSETGLYGEEL